MKRVFVALLVIYPLALLALSLVNVFEPKRTGLLALSEIFAPYLFLPLLLLAPFMLMRGTALLRVLLLACVLVFCVRFPPRLVSAAPQNDPAAIHLSAMQWNVRMGGQYGQIMDVLRRKPAAIVSLVEADWHRLSADPEVASLYPYRLGVEEAGPATGEVLLTTYPVLEEGTLDTPPGLWDVPRLVWARLDVGSGRNVFVVVAHPPPGTFCTRRTFPHNCYNSATRDQRLAAINAFVRPYVEKGDSVLMLGDFNVTDREPAYTDLSAGLVDAQRTVGEGAGVTWRPVSLMSHAFALLRIDYMFSSPNVVPLATSVDCTPRGSDHCIVHGEFELR